VSAPSRPERARRWLLRARVFLYAAIVAGVAFTVWRYDLVELPAEGCSPLFGFEPGDRLVVDRRPAELAPPRALLYRDPSGTLRLGRVAPFPPEAVRGGGDELWVLADERDCPSPDSRVFGPLPRDRVAGRVAFSLPW